jgi:RNA polymerase sigma factor (sigma-70 family)
LNPSQTISLYQPLLQAIALKMVGSWEDAEDIVQDTFVKWLTVDHEKVQNTKAYLIRTVTNNCINHLNSFKKKKSDYLSQLKNSEFLEKYREFEFPRFDLENELSEALAVLHKKLEPVEKGIYLLREVFDFDYEELQKIFGKKKENCRQLFVRAKEKLTQETKKPKTQAVQHFQFLNTFKKACSSGYFSDFIHQLTHEESSDHIK